MSHIPLSSTGSSPMERVMGHAPHVLKPWLQLEETFFRQALLPADLLEQVRRTLAQQHGCQYCVAKSGPPDSTHKDPRTSLAVGLAEYFALDHKSISASQLSILRELFSDAELVELVAFMGFIWAGGTFGSIFGVLPSYAYAET